MVHGPTRGSRQAVAKFSRIESDQVKRWVGILARRNRSDQEAFKVHGSVRVILIHEARFDP